VDECKPLVAGDTFRAAAAEQLQAWAQRSNAVMATPVKEGMKPGALCYQARPAGISLVRYSRR
jgi:fused signal recognition particle receptor